MPFLSRALLLCPLASLGLALAPPPVAAEPMNLSDTRPRWVAVRFEASPADAPGRLDASYDEPIPARLEPDGAPDRVRVTIPALSVESGILEKQGVRPGSLSDFVWHFDARTGDVLSASFSGVVVRHLGVGVFRFDTDVEIRTELSTRTAAGFRSPEQLFGEEMVAYCDPSEGKGCTPVPAIPYDSRTGYVNAVGFVDARAMHLTTRSFSDLGEARFEELEGEALRSAELDGAAPGTPAVSAPGPGVATSTPTAPPLP